MWLEVCDAVVDLVILVDELTEMKVNMDDEDLVKEMYDLIAESFIIPPDEGEVACNRRGWCCYNCSNNNFNSMD